MKDWYRAVRTGELGRGGPYGGERWTIDVGERWTIDVGERWTIDVGGRGGP